MNTISAHIMAMNACEMPKPGCLRSCADTQA